VDRWVDITFDCVPLRSVAQLNAPLDASPKFQAFCQRIRAAIERHGTLNSYYLHNAHCVFHLINHPQEGLVDFSFEGTVLTDASDLHCQTCDLDVQLQRESCDWLIQPVVDWLADTVPRAVAREFDLYIQAGDLQKAKERIERIQKDCDESGGFVGMYL
jgi:hypothetical protein